MKKRLLAEQTLGGKHTVRVLDNGPLSKLLADLAIIVQKNLLSMTATRRTSRTRPCWAIPDLFDAALATDGWSENDHIQYERV